MAVAKNLNEKNEHFGYFTVFFFDKSVLIGNEVLPLGQISTEFLELPQEQLDELFEIMCELRDTFFKKLYNEYPDIVVMPHSKGDLKSFEKTLNTAIDKLLELPLYKRQNINKNKIIAQFEEVYHTESKENSRSILGNFILALISIYEDVILFRAYISAFLDIFVEKVQKRNPEHYAYALYSFLTNDEVHKTLESAFPQEPVNFFSMEHPQKTEYVTMPNPTDKKKYMIAERTVFESLSGFLNADLFKALIAGNAPRRCHNCDHFFLLLNGYNICYCQRTAPNDKKGRTCREVGAHKKEASKEGKPPYILEYNKVYNRLKQRKRNGKISADEWNALVARAQDIRDKAAQGKLSDDEVIRLFQEM